MVGCLRRAEAARKPVEDLNGRPANREKRDPDCREVADSGILNAVQYSVTSDFSSG
jgi:hypothetical protein